MRPTRDQLKESQKKDDYYYKKNGYRTQKGRKMYLVRKHLRNLGYECNRTRCSREELYIMLMIAINFSKAPFHNTYHYLYNRLVKIKHNHAFRDATEKYAPYLFADIDRGRGYIFERLQKELETACESSKNDSEPHKGKKNG